MKFGSCTGRTSWGSTVTICCELLERLEADPNFLHIVITDDYSILEYDSEIKRQSAVWHTHASPKAYMRKSKPKLIFIVFFDKEGVLRKEFVLAEQTVNGKFYVEILERLRIKVHRIRTDILHDDNMSNYILLMWGRLWPNTTWQRCLNPLTVQIWPPWLLFCSLEPKGTWKDIISERLNLSKRLRQDTQPILRLPISRRRISTGKSADEYMTTFYWWGMIVFWKVLTHCTN